jgi:hypothetical protein
MNLDLNILNENAQIVRQQYLYQNHNAPGKIK